MADSTTVVAVTESTTVQVVDGDATVVQTGVPTTLTTTGGGGGAPTSAQYVTLAVDGTLSAERVLTAGSGITITDGGAGSTVTVAVTANTFQPVDSDLTAIAALSTTSFGRGLLALADAAALRSSAGLVIGTDIYSKTAVDSGFQPLDSDLTAIAALTTTTFGRSLLALADAAAGRSALGLGGAAVLNVGTTAGTVAAGDDSRITGAAQKASNLSDLANASTARTNLGLGSLATLSTITTSEITDGTIVNGDISASAAIAGTKVDAATDTTRGAVELATAAETTTGTDATRAVTPDGLAGSEYGVQVVGIMASDMTTAITTGDGKAGFMVPSKINGWNLIRANAGLLGAQSSSGTPTVQIRRVRSGTPADMLSTKITIDANESTSITAATPPVIDTNNDDVATGDLLYVDVDVAGTGAKGLLVTLEFQLP